MQELQAPTQVEAAAFFAAPPSTPSELLSSRALYMADPATVDKFVAAAAEARQGGSTTLAAAASWVCGDYDKALSHADGADDLMRFVRGDSLREMGRLTEACEELSGASTSQDPALAASELHALAAAGNYAQLSKSLKKAKLNPADQHYFQGRVLEVDGSYEEAAQSYGEAIAIQPEHTAAHFRLAFRADLHGDEETAIAHYQTLLNSRPAPLAALLNLGTLYEDRQDFERACGCFSAALRSNPNHDRVRLFFQDAHESLDMYYDEDLERREDELMKVLRTPISDFELSVRARNCLASMDIASLADLVSHSETELLEFKNFGETSLNEIKRVLNAKGLRLGMRREDGSFLIPDEFESNGEFDPAKELSWLGNITDDQRDALELQISTLNLSVRCHRALVERLNLQRVVDILRYSEEDLLLMPNFGITSLEELKIKLDELNLRLRSGRGDEYEGQE